MIDSGDDTHVYGRMAAFTIVGGINVAGGLSFRNHKTVLRVAIFALCRNAFENPPDVAAFTL